MASPDPTIKHDIDDQRSTQTETCAHKQPNMRLHAATRVLLGEVWIQGRKHCFEFLAVDEATLVSVELAHRDKRQQN